MRLSKITSAFLVLAFLSAGLTSAQFETGKSGELGISQREAIALLELKAKTKGHLWTNKWDEDTPIFLWHGVTIRDGKVVGLDLSNNNLQGRIPITIGNLKNLETLNLSQNNISGRIPKLFRKFRNLKTVNFEDNALVGHIPSTINKLQNLQELNLSNNKLKGDLPESITKLSRLSTLALANNDLNGAMPTGMENLKKLKRLYLSNNEFTDVTGLRQLANQQLVLTDFKVIKGDLSPIDFTKQEEGLSKLDFEDYEN